MRGPWRPFAVDSTTHGGGESDTIRAVGVARSVRPRFGQALRERRFDLGWTQARLAASLGVRPSDVARWERAESLPPAATIRAAARVLGASPELARSWLEEVGEAPSSTVREISVQLLGSGLPADPFQESTGARQKVEVPVEAKAPDKPVMVRQTPTGVVFPGRAEAVVYSSAPLDPAASAPSTVRVTLTAAALVALGAVLWWAFGQLGTGLSALFDLFGGPPDPSSFGG